MSHDDFQHGTLHGDALAGCCDSPFLLLLLLQSGKVHPKPVDFTISTCFECLNPCLLQELRVLASLLKPLGEERLCEGPNVSFCTLSSYQSSVFRTGGNLGQWTCFRRRLLCSAHPTLPYLFPCVLSPSLFMLFYAHIHVLHTHEKLQTIQSCRRAHAWGWLAQI